MTEPRVSLHVGKHGITDAVVAELKEQLHKRGVVKVRLHRTAEEAADRRAAFMDLAARSGAVVQRIVGFTAIYTRGT